MKLDLGEAFRLAPNAYMVLDRELRFVAANEMYLKITGTQLDQLLGKGIFELFPNDPLDANNQSLRTLRRSFERVLETRKTDVLAVLAYRVPIVSETGERIEDRFWSATHVPMLDAQGEVAFIMQNTADITELQRLKERAASHSALEASVLRRATMLQDANALIEEQRRQLADVFEQAPSFMAFLRGASHVFEFANAAYERLVGRPVAGMSVAQALPEVVEQGFIDLLDAVFRSGEPFIGRGMQLMLQEGSETKEVFLDFIYQPIRAADGKVVGIFVQGHDITEQKRAEAQLRESERNVRELNEALERRVAERTTELRELNQELESFSYSVSHDLRAPLRHITGFAQLLEKRAASSLDAGSLDYLKTISESARQGGQLVDDLLAFSRMGRKEMSKLRVSLRAIVDELRAELAPEQRERDVQWDYGALPDVVADPSLLRAALRNLLTNALKYTRTRAQAQIQITAERAEGEVRVSIRDNGVGFDMRYVDKLFGVFQRLHTSEEFEGTGIGLANVRRIITRHGGRVWVDAAVDRGATFSFALPDLPS